MGNCLELGNRIQQAAECAAMLEGVSVTAIARYLRFGETTPPAGDGELTYRAVEQEAAYGRAKRTALRTLFDLLSELLPSAARMAEPVGRESIQRRIEPLVKGLLPDSWQEDAIRELTDRTYVLDVQGARAGLEAELSTGFTETAWKVLWACFEDYGLAPMTAVVEFDGVSAGSYAHCRFPAYYSKDPYSDIVVHEAAHLLHYLKPERFGLPVPRGKERFVDVDFQQRELFAYACEAFSCVTRCESRASRVQFAEKMLEGAFSFPPDQLGSVSDLVLAAARAPNGWRTVRDATIVPIRRRTPAHKKQSIRQL